MDDFCYAGELSALLDSMDRTDELPKTILYCLNQRDYEMLASMCGNFQSAPHRGKIQFGTAWWFCDNKRGMEAQLDVLANLSLRQCQSVCSPIPAASFPSPGMNITGGSSAIKLAAGWKTANIPAIWNFWEKWCRISVITMPLNI